MAGNTTYKNRYNLEKYDRINVTLKKGDKEKIKARADEMGLSINAYIRNLIMGDIDRGGNRRKTDRDMEIYLY